MSVARASRSAPSSASAATAVDACVPLMSARPSFASSATGASPARASAAPPSSAAASVADRRVPFADQHERQVRQRREVAARADRSAARHDRMDARVERVDQPIERRAPDARVALREHVRAQRHHRAHGARRQRLADARRVAAQQVPLELAERVSRNLDLGQRAEAGVDAVDRRVARRVPIDDGARGVDGARGRARRARPVA